MEVFFGSCALGDGRRLSSCWCGGSSIFGVAICNGSVGGPRDVAVQGAVCSSHSRVVGLLDVTWHLGVISSFVLPQLLGLVFLVLVAVGAEVVNSPMICLVRGPSGGCGMTCSEIGCSFGDDLSFGSPDVLKAVRD